MVGAKIWGIWGEGLGSDHEQGSKEGQSQPYGWVLRSESDVTKRTSHDTRKLRQFDYYMPNSS